MTTIQIRTAPAIAVAVLALMAASAGGAVAGSKITGAQIKNSSVTGADIKNGSLSADDFSAAGLTSLKGPAGPAGSTGAVGATGQPGPATLPGLQLIEGSIGVAANSSDALTRVCPAGKTVVSVSGYTSGPLLPIQPYIVSSQNANVNVNNTTSNPITLNIQLLCATGTR